MVVGVGWSWRPDQARLVMIHKPSTVKASAYSRLLLSRPVTLQHNRGKNPDLPQIKVLTAFVPCSLDGGTVLGWSYRMQPALSGKQLTHPLDFKRYVLCVMCPTPKDKNQHVLLRTHHTLCQSAR